MFQKIRKKAYELIHRQPYGTEKVVKLYDIKVKGHFKKSIPKEHIIELAREYYNKKGYVDMPISVRKVLNKKGRVKYILLDEYTRYLVLKEMKIEKIPIKIVEDETTKYEK